MSWLPTGMNLPGIPRTESPGSTQLSCLSSEVREQALQLLPNKRINDSEIIDHQGGAIIEAEKFIASAQRVQLCAVATDKQEALEIATMIIQGNGFKALNRALL